jgi:N-acetylmuramoyl-L-alanine amidase
MKVLNHRLCQDDGTPFRFERAPNVGGKLVPEYLVIHSTEGQTVAGALATLMHKDGPSVHLVIGRDGSIIQLVPFNVVAKHAGPGSWEGRSWPNLFTLGIELDNAGLMRKNAANKWQAWFGKVYPDEEVIQEPHKFAINDTQRSWAWHTYTTEQLEALQEVAFTLVNRYSLRDIIGHDDTTPRRKWDPGPVFPMESLRSTVLGHKDILPVTFLTNIDLQLRAGPGIQHAPLLDELLPAGTRVVVLERQIDWVLVDVLDFIGGRLDLQGWLQGDHIRRSNL